MRLTRYIPAAIGVVTVMLSFAAAVTSQEQVDGSSLRYRAGSTVGRRDLETGSSVKILSDSLVAWHLDAELRAREGVLTTDPVMMRVYGNASFRDSLRRLTADTLIYYENTREARFIGNVHATEGGRSLWADMVRYLKNERLLIAEGNVAVRDDSLRSSMDGRTAVFNDSTNNGIITGNPVLRRIEPEGSIMTVTAGDTIRFLRDEKLITLWNAVEMTRDSLRATAGRAVYSDSSETMTLLKGPVVHYTSVDSRGGDTDYLTTVSTIEGDTIRVYLRDRNITRADVVGSAVSRTTAVDSTAVVVERSVIGSRSMGVYLENEAISLMSAMGTATSYYQREQDDTDDIVVNRAAGDTLNFYFDNGHIDRLRIFGYGGGLGAGTYYTYEPESAQAEGDTSAAGESDPPR